MLARNHSVLQLSQEKSICQKSLKLRHPLQGCGRELAEISVSGNHRFRWDGSDQLVQPAPVDGNF
jgi:hypothetical protein